MKTFRVAAGGALLAAVTSIAFAKDDVQSFSARLNSYAESPSVSSVARGSIRLKVNEEAQTISYELTYEGLEGTAAQAHIHFGQRSINGGIMLWLCANNPPITNAPAGTPTCPTTSGTVSGLLTAAQVVGPAGQGVAAMEFAEAVRAIRANGADRSPLTWQRACGT
jgi:hypothetical protein